MRGDWSDFSIRNGAAYQPVKTADYGGAGRESQRIYLHIPVSGTGFPATVWFHGGGLTGGGREVPDVLFDGRMAVIEARYRLSPDFPAPAALSDAAAAVARVLKDAKLYGIDPARVYVGGMSAGAYLAAMTGMDGGYLAAHGFDHRKLAGLLLISGQMTTHFQLKIDLHYPQTQFQPVIDRYAPLYHLSPELPPILLVTGESGRDMPGRPEENALMAASLAALGHRMVRCFHLEGCDHGETFDHSEPSIAAFLKELGELGGAGK